MKMQATQSNWNFRQTVYNILVYICPMQSLGHADTQKSDVSLKIRSNVVACSYLAALGWVDWFCYCFMWDLPRNSRPEKGPVSGFGRGGPGPVLAGPMPVACAGPAQLGALRSLRPPLERADLGSCFALGLRPWLFHLSYWVKPPVAVTWSGVDDINWIFP